MQWGLRMTSVAPSAPRQVTAWSLVRAAPAVVVCIIDSGVDVTHPDLRANLWVNPHEIPGNGVDDDDNGCVDDVHGCTFMSGDRAGHGDVSDPYHHGTHLAGIVGSVGNNGMGGSGVAQRVQLMSCRAFDRRGRGSMLSVLRCMQYCRHMKAHITLNSYGEKMPHNPLFHKAASAMHEAGLLFVTAAGNSGHDLDAHRDIYPAAFAAAVPSVLVVAGSEPSDTVAPYSNYGAEGAHIFAPGTWIWSTTPLSQGSYAIYSGTSQAAAFVAGAAALLLARLQQRGVSITGRSTLLKQTLLNSADKVPAFARKCSSNGRLNVLAALVRLEHTMLPPPPIHRNDTAAAASSFTLLRQDMVELVSAREDARASTASLSTPSSPL